MLAAISPRSPPDTFPPTKYALREPNGLLAVGGDLSCERLIAAYTRGIFPWYSDGDPVLWWTPSPRSVLYPQSIRISRSLRKTIRQARYSIHVNQAFDEVISACAAPRRDGAGTWIDSAMNRAYRALHREGFAHSIESWDDEGLAGGLYGVAIGQVFFGESMFARRPDASKVALAHLCTMGYSLIDCQLASPHLERMGATSINRQAFERELAALTPLPVVTHAI